jgi:hypothetical protein
VVEFALFQAYNSRGGMCVSAETLSICFGANVKLISR